MWAIQVILPRSLRLAEIFTVILGLGPSTFAISTRIFVKLRITRKFLSEDYFSVAAYVSSLPFLALAIFIGKNSGDIRHKAYLSMVERVLYDVSIVLVKTSILLQYVTVFVVNRRSFFHFLIHVIIWGNAIFYCIITFQFIFHCEPRRKLWLSYTPGTCHHDGTQGITSGGGNVVTDFIILILPLPVLWRLQMPLKKKLRCVSVFGVGVFACIASVVRFVYSFHLINKDPRVSQLNVDRQGLFAYAELAIGIIVGCIPSVHKCYRQISNKGFGFNHLLRIPYSSTNSSSRGRRYWRKLFARSSSSSSSAIHPQKFSGSANDGTAESSAAPHITTLNMTRASFSLEEKNAMPTPPAPVHIHAQKKEETEGSSSMDDETYEKVQDEESGRTRGNLSSWQQNVAEDGHRTNGGRNYETTRAQHEIYSRE